MHSVKVQLKVVWVIPERGARQRKTCLKDGAAARHVERAGHHRAAPAADIGAPVLSEHLLLHNLYPTEVSIYFMTDTTVAWIAGCYLHAAGTAWMVNAKYPFLQQIAPST